MAILAEPGRPARTRPVPAPEPTRRLPAGDFDFALRTTPVPRSVLSVTGWAVTRHGPCSRVDLTVNGRQVGRARLGELRPELETLFDLPSAVLCGFQHLVDLRELPDHLDEVELGGFAVGLDGTRFALRPARAKLENRRSDGRAAPEPGSIRRRLPPARANGTGPDLRLLVCAHELGYGGAQLFLSELLRQITNNGPATGVVLSPREGPTRRILEEIGFEVHVTSPFPMDSYDEYVARLEELSGWAERFGFNAALVNTMGAFPGADLAARLRLPALWAIHESLTLPEYWAVGGAVETGIRRRAELALTTATLAFTCDATRDCYERSTESLRRLTLPYGIDIGALDAWRADFDRAGARQREGIAEDQTLILCLGTIEPRKAQTQLIHAFARIADRHPKALLHLVGSRGDEYSEVAYTAVALHGIEDRVRIHPVLPDVRPCYATADLLVCASDVESTPRSILEAMALGLPVLSTDVFGVPELIEDGESGWLCPPRDVSALAEALDRVLSLDAGQRRQAAQAARARAEADYRSDVCSRGWDQALRALATSAGDRAVPTLRTKPDPAEVSRS